MFAASPRPIASVTPNKPATLLPMRHPRLLENRPAAQPGAPVTSSVSMLSLFRGKKRHTHLAPPASAGPATAVELADAPSTSAVAASTPLAASLAASSVAVSTNGKVLKLVASAVCLPHPDKIHYGGEDAHFVSDYGGGALGVADGVGGWQESGVNPADYSRGLMQNARDYLEGNGLYEESAAARSGVIVDPRGALDAAHLNTKVAGSATACVMQLDQANRTLVAANLGDSGFIVIRDGKELVKSKPLQHYFDCPLQFGAFPEFVEATDTADMADLYTIALQPGDIIVAGSDGLWDNCFLSEIIDNSPAAPADVERAANDIAAVARKHAADQDFPSPYTREALAQGLDLPWWDKLMGMSLKGGRLQLKQLTGGKMDDITVIVALVAEADPPPPPPPAAEPSEGEQPVASSAS